jgi:ubiquinone/menaquinone biosynthesis C-methylase UbiE
MVGCGNSKLSEEMSLEGYCNITNIDISTNVIEKMSAVYSNRFYMQEYQIIDATRMAYRDSSFDICIDKGTFDALACGSDLEVPMRLLSEMMRVCRVATLIVTSGTPEKRLHYFDKVSTKIEYK